MAHVEASIETPTPESTLRDVLAAFVADPESPAPREAQMAAHLARHVQRRAVELQTPQERRQQAELERMMSNPGDKATLVRMTDEAFRSSDPHRAVDQLAHVLDVQGVPRFFGPVDRTMLRGFQSFGGYLPGVAVPLVREKMRAETANVVLPAERELLKEHLASRRASGLRMNVNFLGEALLGEDEAQARLEMYLGALQDPAIECISVKISTVYSQIASLALEHTVDTLCDRLELLYRAAARAAYLRADGAEVPKLVYLDMEEYRDMEVTARAFMRTLARPGLEQARGGIALQAYLPDSHAMQRRINAWARERVAAGGAPVTIRLVKGANMEMERVEAAIQGWPTATFTDKLDTDASYKRMLAEAMRPENLAAVHVGIASHNVLDLAYGLVLAHQRGCGPEVQVEMLEGMANHQRRALGEVWGNLLLYAPATRREDFVHAIGYLIRRLDENTGEDNFLRHTFRLSADSDAWRRLESGFYAAFERVATLPETSRRGQDRRRPIAARPAGELRIDTFTNEPNTDFSRTHNVEWANAIVERWAPRHGEAAAEVPLVIGGEETLAGREVRESLDPSRPGHVVARYRVASEADVATAVATARADPDGWRSLPAAERAAVLGRAADAIRAARGDLMGAAMAEGGKTFGESDAEVSEAVDFCEFYRRSALELASLPGLAAAPKGVVAVVSPWNFPVAIPCGGVAAALAAGNTAVLKPASDTVLVAYELARCFWRAGVPRTALQFAPAPGAGAGAALALDPGVDVVVLTGGTDTALRLLDARPEMNLIAETGGKDATIVTALSDHELAIKHVLQSAFGHAGQKCSATSLLVLEAEVYDDPEFKRMLCDAVRSLRVGSAWHPDTAVGPLIRPPAGALARGLKELEPGESWAVMPRHVGDNPHLYTPGVKWGVQRGSFTHLTELFGPVLGVMRASSLEAAIAIVNETGYGLTSGLESLDDREQALWRDRIRAGNLYINRHTTGAVVLRQPFGGMGKSAFGPGIKAGGPSYVAQLMDFAPTGPPAAADTVDDPLLERLREDLLAPDAFVDARVLREARERIVLAIASYALAWREEFARVHDHFRLPGQDNLRRYLPIRELRVRVDRADDAFDLFARVCAARTAGCRITVSAPPGHAGGPLEALEWLTERWGARIELVEESDDELAAAICDRQTERVRYAGPERAPEQVLRAVGDSGIFIARAPVLAAGRIELAWYLREQSISFDYHRYGNLGPRTGEERRPIG